MSFSFSELEYEMCIVVFGVLVNLPIVLPQWKEVDFELRAIGKKIQSKAEKCFQNIFP